VKEGEDWNRGENSLKGGEEERKEGMTSTLILTTRDGQKKLGRIIV